MPTFFDSAADAAEASEALRGLAHASRTFDQPAQMYGVIGDLSSGMRSLHQVLEQLADVHERKAAHAFHDDGNHAAGVRDALATAEELRRSARLVDQAYDRLAEGFIAAGRIAWHPEPAVEEAAPSRWVNVVFFQGDEAATSAWLLLRRAFKIDILLNQVTVSSPVVDNTNGYQPSHRRGVR